MNLEALTEEDLEDPWDSERDDSGNASRKKGNPNKFDSMCDGVLGSMSILHASFAELLDLKDELLKHTLPPNVLTKLALCTAKCFRSASDLNIPINEMIRLVRIYSTPWEEKSASLKKLHDDYESKKSQLTIAIKRLQLVDQHSKRMVHEKRIMNWEKLFCKLTTAKGHGRRWKFLIDNFKKKASEGMESLHDYIESMQRADSESEDEDDLNNIETQMQHVAPSDTAPTDLPTQKESSDEEEEDSDTSSKTEEESEENEKPAAPVYIKPPMKDKQVWTGDPSYDRYLHIRVYEPQGLDCRELKCALTFGKQNYKTKVLDIKEEESSPSNPTAVEPQAQPQPPSTPVRGRGLIGSRGGRGRVGRGGRSGASSLPQTIEEVPEPKKPKHFEECIFDMPEEYTHDVLLPSGEKTEKRPDAIQIAVHFGPRDEMVAMATVDMDDLDNLDLPNHILEPPDGAFEDPNLPMYIEEAKEEGEDRSSQSATPTIDNMDPINFPLYPLEIGRSEKANAPVGQLPLLCFWAKRLRPTSFNKETEADSVNKIVMTETGFDMDTLTYDDLHPDLVERSISAASFVSSESTVKEETVPRTEYDHLMNTHREEMEMLQDEYEQRLQELADSMQHMNTLSLDQPPTERSPIYQRRPGSSTQPSPNMEDHHLNEEIDPNREESSEEFTHPNQIKRPLKNFLVHKRLPNWGGNLPENFLDRLRYFEERSLRHKENLMAQQGQEKSEKIEQCLAGEYKLKIEANDEDEMFNALQDVSLPAVFLPTKGKDLSIYNPRAHQYFHPTGSSGARLTQPPSMLQLPPLPKNRLAVVNLFDLGKNFQRGGVHETMMKKFLAQQEPSAPGTSTASFGQSAPTSAHDYNMQYRDHGPMPTRESTNGMHEHKEAVLD
ncbi:hypothetical protein CAPTEDRAFT_227737 [Capitella teleta]|uniref:Uncharacterized protein n=1 Tax=Capitella teleta TaxID=283909 RepID=R7UNH6_CAPTE|nr:hypothetical protein CAPTEDRAFT_227737 [Capitella teleta]|eukprot:ELU08059.1 hypothetical protein CAPTEDRAFT_227737 [Capitella teleta]